MTCNNDCFNCIYPDCIKTGYESKITDKDEMQCKRKERRRAYNMRYRQEHKAELAEKKRIYDKKYRAEHKEKLHQREAIRWQKTLAARAVEEGTA